MSASDGAAYVRLVAISKRFGDVLAVKDVSLAIERGEIFCLLGASGSGKTTLLRLLAGFETPSSGQLFLDGEDVTMVPPYRRPLNMMFQSYALFPHLSVERNVAFGLEQERLPRAQIVRRVGEILDVVKMQPYRQRKPHQLSGGQRQRVALARALVKRPKLLLLDEPLAALDRQLRGHTQFELLNIQQQLGVTFIVVTHDQEEAMTLASRMAVMSQGEIVQVGTPRQIYEQPATRLVASFIGTVNLFEGQIVDAGTAHVQIHCAELPVPLLIERHRLQCAAEGSRWVALRPEQIGLASTPPLQSHNWAQGTIREVAYLGEQSMYLVRLDSGREVRVSCANATRAREQELRRGMPIYLSWDVDSPATGVA